MICSRTIKNSIQKSLGGIRNVRVIALVLIAASFAPPIGAKVHVGFMVHLEDTWTDDTDIDEFDGHAENLRFGAGVFNSFGAKFTAECALPFAKGCERWGKNVLREMLDSNMGVGSHSNEAIHFEATREIVDRLVGPMNNRGVSGGWGPTSTVDWAREAARLGYLYIDAPVYMAYLLVPVEDRPDMVTDEQILADLFHNPVPPVFEERIHPRRISYATSWPTDTDGPILLMTGSMGEFSSLAEGRSACSPSCVLDSADVDTLVARVYEAVSVSSPDEFTVVYCHVPLKWMVPENAPLFLRLFRALQPLMDDGSIEYGTMGQIYDAAPECCQGRRGNFDMLTDDGADITITDLTFLVEFQFKNGPKPACPSESDIDANGRLDIADLTYLVSFMFNGGAQPYSCKTAMVARPTPPQSNSVRVRYEHTDSSTQVYVATSEALLAVEISAEGDGPAITPLHSYEEMDIIGAARDGEATIGIVDLSGNQRIEVGDHKLCEILGKWEIKSVAASTGKHKAISLSVSISEDATLPQEFSLEPNYPNPFNPTTTIPFSLSQGGQVSVEVYNVQGQRIASLMNTNLDAGEHSVTWDASEFSSGIYFYRIATESRAHCQKMMLIK